MHPFVNTPTAKNFNNMTAPEFVQKYKIKFGTIYRRATVETKDWYHRITKIYDAGKATETLQSIERRKPGITADYLLCEKYENAYNETREKSVKKAIPFTIKWPVKTQIKSADFVKDKHSMAPMDAAKVANVIAEIKKTGHYTAVVDTENDTVTINYTTNGTNGQIRMPLCENVKKILAI